MKLYNDDCLKILPTIPDKSIDLILTDPPYGTTQCKWDSVIPFEPMWNEIKRVIKDNGCIVCAVTKRHVCNVQYIGRTKVQGYTFVMGRYINVTINLKEVKFDYKYI